MSMNPYRKLLVFGLNEIISLGLISLESIKEEEGYHLAEISGHSSLISWHDAGFGELICAVWWDYKQEQDPNFNRYGKPQVALPGKHPTICTPGTRPLFAASRMPRVIGAAAAGWLERKTGCHLQGKGPQRIINTYMRAGSRAILDAIPDPIPLGFAASGKIP